MFIDHIPRNDLLGKDTKSANLLFRGYFPFNNHGVAGRVKEVTYNSQDSLSKILFQQTVQNEKGG
jgi:hypothetical protein